VRAGRCPEQIIQGRPLPSSARVAWLPVDTPLIPASRWALTSPRGSNPVALVVAAIGHQAGVAGALSVPALVAAAIAS